MEYDYHKKQTAAYKQLKSEIVALSKSDRNLLLLDFITVCQKFTTFSIKWYSGC